MAQGPYRQKDSQIESQRDKDANHLYGDASRDLRSHSKASAVEECASLDCSTTCNDCGAGASSLPSPHSDDVAAESSDVDDWSQLIPLCQATIIDMPSDQDASEDEEVDGDRARFLERGSCCESPRSSGDRNFRPNSPTESIGRCNSHGCITPQSITLKLLQPSTTPTMFLPMS